MVGQVGCVAYSNSISTSYGYRPSLIAGIIFTVLFILSTILHVYQMVPKRVWWLLVFAIGGLAPNFSTAGCYIALSRLIHCLGRQHSPISPRLYLYIFCACDIISLVIQSVGGASASAAFSKVPQGNPKPGTNTMVGGIVFQLASIIVFASFFVRVMWSARIELQKAKEVQLVALATATSVILIFIRSIYRTIELSQGWSGFLITHEGYFIALDGTMMVLAISIFNLFSPNLLLRSLKPDGRGLGLYGPEDAGFQAEKEQGGGLKDDFEPAELQAIKPK